MSDVEPSPGCTVTCASGAVVILAPNMATISLSPARAVRISTLLLETAAVAYGQPAWKRD